MGAKKLNEYLDGDMPSNLGERMNFFLLKKGYSRDEFGKGCGTSGTTTVTGYINGKSKPSADFLELAAKNFDLNPLWLTMGIGPMLLSEVGQGCQSAQAAEKELIDYEKECLRLKHEVADQTIAHANTFRKLTDIENQLAGQQRRITKAVQIMARRLGLAAEQTLELTDAVSRYELVIAEEEHGGPIKSHQAAVGDE